MKDRRISVTQGLSMYDSSFGADIYRHSVDPGCIEGRGQADGLRELGRSVYCDAMQRLAPPVVCRHFKSRNRARLIHQLRCLLCERHAADQILGAYLSRQIRIQVCRRIRCLRNRARYGNGTTQHYSTAD